ncbi:unnamed protein product [Cyprideis torosa]|uniref:Uncharacterized protein n=1 Tax=Cyprideis torosa TaxID=163714 RepID=A0A7R8WED8_9CRUS|nr:unnamed protein product [Cyprideis torosa]CAG0895627.1 unnamed protein product [Cyprideis torosa]
MKAWRVRSRLWWLEGLRPLVLGFLFHLCYVYFLCDPYILDETDGSSVNSENVLHQKSLATATAGHNLKRPWFVSNELRIRDRLLVAVYLPDSSDKSRTLAKALNQTLQRSLRSSFPNAWMPGERWSSVRLLFLVPESSQKETSMVQLPPSSLEAVPLRALEYLLKHQLTYDFVFLCPVHSYVNLGNLRAFISGVSENSLSLHGPPFVVKQGPEEVCWNGGFAGGLLFSYHVLKMLEGTPLATRDAGSPFEGRCFSRATPRNMSSSPFLSFSEHAVSTEDEVLDYPASTISVTGISSLQEFFKLHAFFLKVLIKSMREDIERLSIEVPQLRDKSGLAPRVPPVRIPEPFAPRDRMEVIRWLPYAWKNPSDEEPQWQYAVDEPFEIRRNLTLAERKDYKVWEI